MPTDGHKRPIGINDHGTCDDAVVPENCQYVYQFDNMKSPFMDLVILHT